MTTAVFSFLEVFLLVVGVAAIPSIIKWIVVNTTLNLVQIGLSSWLITFVSYAGSVLIMSVFDESYGLEDIYNSIFLSAIMGVVFTIAAYFERRKQDKLTRLVK